MTDIIKSEPHAIQAMATLSTETKVKLVLSGDLKGLTDPQKIEYYNWLCARCGLDPATQPFEYLKLKDKEVLYAKKSAAEQLRNIGGISVIECTHSVVNGVIICRVTVRDNKGRTDCGIGAVSCGGLTGESLAIAYMKAETKAKRRATLSVCGLGMFDESETDNMGAWSGSAVIDENADCKSQFLIDDEVSAKKRFQAVANSLAGKTLTPEQLRAIQDQTIIISQLETITQLAMWLESNGVITFKGEIVLVSAKSKDKGETHEEIAEADKELKTFTKPVPKKEEPIQENRYLCNSCGNEFDTPKKGKVSLCPKCFSDDLLDRRPDNG